MGLLLGSACSVRGVRRNYSGDNNAPQAPGYRSLHVARYGCAATFSVVNVLRVRARHRKRCGECKSQPSEAEMPGSGTSIALGTGLDALPEALVLGVQGGLFIGLSRLRRHIGNPAGQRSSHNQQQRRSR
jgi:hypothetical protein